MTKWEYQTIKIPAYESDLFSSTKFRMTELDDILKDYGNDGWELASQSFTGDIRWGTGDMVLIFKRPKE
ncbi:hypothetical protein EMA8858_00098 [Emticicia aquatica]|jgi:hypothetical protein|uniref:DUF4177 domain-containing protein n=1 Tax=Emticicia aquatica TaxID=1681835 RepID=A0ABN8EMA4_9BACT|nr:DUF4177 domain-containing protein [Emticicia aquatica]CAH0993991.1 hypothetical protein EMA8858_00098 [Emticicia aquatica]